VRLRIRGHRVGLAAAPRGSSTAVRARGAGVARAPLRPAGDRATLPSGRRWRVPDAAEAPRLRAVLLGEVPAPARCPAALTVAVARRPRAGSAPTHAARRRGARRRVVLQAP